MTRRLYLTTTGILLLALAAVAAALALPRAGASPSGQAPPEAPPAPEAAVTLESALTTIHETVSPSVVNVQVVIAEQFQPFPEMPRRETMGLGSGFVWDEQGHIVTNQHVIANASEITVTFMDGTVAPAQVVGADRDSDLAVLRVDPSTTALQPIAIGDPTQLRVGQIAVAIGNPFGLEGTMTYGIVSGTGRALPVTPEGGVTPETMGVFQIPDIVQTDASINPGNSGGALVNISGELIGVPTAIIAPQLGAGAGIGFAVSSALVQRVVPSVIETGTYRHPYLGVSLVGMAPAIAREMDLPASQRGALVAQLANGGPAQQAGLRAGTQTMVFRGQDVNVGGDIITAIDGEPVLDSSDLISYLALNVQPGDTVTLTVLRDGEERTVEISVAARPSPANTATPLP